MNTAITTAAGTAVKYDAQALTDAQKTQALTNLGIAYATDAQITSMLTEIGISA